MGHCGNQPRSYSSDKILSLRQTIKKQGHEFLKPYLTFILLDNGSLGEMKGRFNKSPKNAFAAGYSPSDFHDEIVALLKLPMITGITGGGYLPQENFKVSDLPKEQADALTEMKPSLLTVLEQYQRFGMTEDLGKRISSTAEEAGRDITYHPDQKAFEVEQFDSLKDFAKDFVATERHRRQPMICWILDVLDGTENLDIYDGADDYGKQGILDEVKKKQPDYYAAIAAYIEATYRKENGIDDEDDDDLPSLLDMITELDEKVDAALTRACYNAMERGAENEMSDAAEEWISNLKAVGGEFWLMFSSDHWADSHITLMLSVPKVIQWMQDDNFDSYPKDAISVRDVDEPRYGYQGFDEASGAERFIDDLDEESDIFDSIRRPNNPAVPEVGQDPHAS